MRPDEFGAVNGDPTFDSGPALNEFFAHCATHRVDDADISGDWYTKRQRSEPSSGKPPRR